jgi:DNA-binding transcriptional ArsR family regulator
MVKPSTESPQLDRIFHALSDTTRRSILRHVAAKEMAVSEIAQPYRMSLAAVSKHLKVLERANLIAREKRGSFQFVRTNPLPMKQAQRWLSFYERFWNERLDQFEQYFKDKKEKKGKNNEQN